jgi:hypothetical protein
VSQGLSLLAASLILFFLFPAHGPDYQALDGFIPSSSKPWKRRTPPAPPLSLPHSDGLSCPYNAHRCLDIRQILDLPLFVSPRSGPRMSIVETPLRALPSAHACTLPGPHHRRNINIYRYDPSGLLRSVGATRFDLNFSRQAAKIAEILFHSGSPLTVRVIPSFIIASPKFSR